MRNWPGIGLAGANFSDLSKAAIAAEWRDFPARSAISSVDLPVPSRAANWRAVAAWAKARWQGPTASRPPQRF